jgi:hypothetical protein
MEGESVEGIYSGFTLRKITVWRSYVRDRGVKSKKPRGQRGFLFDKTVMAAKHRCMPLPQGH